MQGFSSLVWFTLLTSTACAHSETAKQAVASQESPLTLASSVLDTVSLDWQPRAGYVGMSIPYQPVAALKEQLEAQLRMELKGRGEAHITVITPPELKQLRSLLSLEDIHALVEKSDIQSTPLTIVCLGRAEIKDQNRQLATYFIVVEAVGLRALREQIDQLFEARGGSVEAFDPALYDPHITIGFTDRDLHRQDGISKNRKSCIQSISLTP